MDLCFCLMEKWMGGWMEGWMDCWGHGLKRFSAVIFLGDGLGFRVLGFASDV